MDRMKKIIKKALVLSMALLFFAVYAFVPLSAAATPAGAVTTIGVSKKEIKVGDSLSVTITCTAEASITLRYSSSRLKLEDPGSGTADGNMVTFKATRNTIRFTATAAGKADLIVASADAGVAGSSASVTVTDAAAQAPASSAAPQAPASSAAPQAPASSAAPEVPSAPAAPAAPVADLPKGQVSTGGNIYAVSERYTDAMIPAGFSKTSLSIAKGTYEEISNGTVTLVYLKLINNGTMENEGSFFYYDSAKGTFAPLIPYLGTFVIPFSEADIPQEDRLSSSLFEKADLTFNNGATITTPDSYVLKADPGDFHYVYAMTFEGRSMWFNYDTAAGTLQRADSGLIKDYQTRAGNGGSSVTPSSGEAASSTASSSQTAQESKSQGISFQKVLLIIIIFIVIFIILVIISMIPKRRDDDDDDDEDEEEDFGRSIVKKEYADEEEEDDDDLPYGDDEDDDEDIDYEDEEEEVEEKPKEKAPEKTRVMPDVSDNGLRKILSSDSIIASGNENAESQVKKQSAPAPQKKEAVKEAAGTNSAPVSKKPAAEPQGSDNAGEASSSKKIDVMDLNDL